VVPTKNVGQHIALADEEGGLFIIALDLNYALAGNQGLEKQGCARKASQYKLSNRALIEHGTIRGRH